jgi:hypothetical protein
MNYLQSATKNPLLISGTSNKPATNNLMLANQQRIFRCWKSIAGLLASDYPLLIVSIRIFVAVKSATNKSVTKKSATTNLHRIFVVADSVTKLF